MKTLLVKDAEGEFKIELSDEAHVTFGPDVPFEAKNARFEHGGGRSYSLRVYADAAKKELLATFNKVAWFRNMSIKQARLVVREQGTSVWKSDESGYETTTKGSVSREFVDSAKLLTGEVVKKSKGKK